jgi:diguanylate cyclase (GGDEF)-like protein
MTDQSDRFAGTAAASPAEENVLLRAALADAQRRIEELEALAEADPLTGLANARRFAREVERATGRATRHATPAALVGFDLRNLAAINARHGRAVGDAALAHLARTLSSLIRASDQLARTGGSELALLFDHLDSDSAIETSERLQRCIARTPLDLGSDKVPLEVVVATTGIMPGDEPEGVLARAARNIARARDDA